MKYMQFRKDVHTKVMSDDWNQYPWVSQVIDSWLTVFYAGGPLHLGEIEELPDKSNCIKCPWHSWKFNITTGECIFPGHPSNKRLTVYPIRLNKDEIRIGFPRIAKKYFQTPPWVLSVADTDNRIDELHVTLFNLIWESRVKNSALHSQLELVGWLWLQVLSSTISLRQGLGL